MGRMSATGRSLTVPRTWRASIVRLAKGYGRAMTAVRILRTAMILWASIFGVEKGYVNGKLCRFGWI